MRVSQEPHCNVYHIPHGGKRIVWIKMCPTLHLLALRSGITVASEVHPRRGYCWLKTFPNTPQDGLKHSRLCNFWRPTQGPHKNLEKGLTQSKSVLWLLQSEQHNLLTSSKWTVRQLTKPSVRYYSWCTKADSSSIFVKLSARLYTETEIICPTLYWNLLCESPL